MAVYYHKYKHGSNTFMVVICLHVYIPGVEIKYATISPHPSTFFPNTSSILIFVIFAFIFLNKWPSLPRKYLIEEAGGR